MKIGVFYASMSGNTEAIADLIVKELKEQNHEVELKDIVDMDSAADLLDYDMTYVGMYTWGDGEYPDECLDVTDELEQMDLQQYPFALFGSGDTAYPEFCGALDLLKDLIEAQGGVTVGEPLRIEFNPEPEDEEMIQQFIADTVAKVEMIQS